MTTYYFCDLAGSQDPQPCFINREGWLCRMNGEAVWRGGTPVNGFVPLEGAAVLDRGHKVCVVGHHWLLAKSAQDLREYTERRAKLAMGGMG